METFLFGDEGGGSAFESSIVAHMGRRLSCSQSARNQEREDSRKSELSKNKSNSSSSTTVLASMAAQPDRTSWPYHHPLPARFPFPLLTQSRQQHTEATETEC
jgi:hypothetical protein